MKKSVTVCWLFVLTALTTTAQPYEIWLSPTGSDRNPGTKDKPMATLSMSVRKARELRRSNTAGIEEGIHIILKEGLYQQYEPVYIRTEDSGTETSPTVIRSATNERAVISGGIKATDWKKVKEAVSGLPKIAQGKVWATDIPSVWDEPVNFRELWVNGRKADKASSLHDGELDRLFKSDSLKEELWIPIPELSLENAKQLEFNIIQWWTLASLRIKTYEIIGDHVKLTFHQPESKIEFEHPWPMPVDDSMDIYRADTKYPFCGNSPFYFSNSIELLNRPGEWCRDVKSGKLYYWPLEEEDMKKAEVVIPMVETLVHIEGSLDNPVKNITFEGLNFEYTSWLRPSVAGNIPLQDGMYLIDAYKLHDPGTPGNATLENQAWLGRQAAGVELYKASKINFYNCAFRHLAATGLDFVSGVNHCKIEGCLFNDIGGSGIKAGFYGDLSIESHLPYDPSDFREVCHHITISNNLITDCTNEYWGCDGINVAFAHDVNIEHNELSHLNNSGISLGWGWTGVVNCMKNNRIHANNIHHFAKQLYDVAGIYVLSAMPNSELSNNYIHHIEKAPYAHLDEHYHYIYLDQNSSFIRVFDNWTETERFNANATGPGNEWENNGPAVSAEVKQKAGLEAKFNYLLKMLDD